MLITRSRIILLIWAMSFMISEAIHITIPSVSQFSTLADLIISALLLFIWCEWHAQENGVRPPRFASILCAVFTLVGVPYYLFKTFGFQQGGIKLLWGLLFSAIAYVSGILIPSIIFGVPLSF